MLRSRIWLGGVVCLLVWSIGLQAQTPEKAKLPKGVKATYDLEYVPKGHERNKLDIYEPEDAKGALPLVVWVHGGAWRGGSKDRCPAVFLVNQGYTVASINYRLSQHDIYPAQIEDCKAAIRFLRANADKYHIDTKHVGVWGASAGGHLVALMGTGGSVSEWNNRGGNKDQSSAVQAVCDWFGPTDFTQFADRVVADPKSALAILLGGAVSEKKEQAAKANPITFISKETPPFLIMHGDEDPTVPLSQSKILEEALKKAGVEVRLEVLKGAKHGGPEFQTPEVVKQIGDFFDKHLKK